MHMSMPSQNQPEGDENQEEPATPTQDFTWNHQNCLLLLDEYQSRKDKFANPKIRNKSLWEEIAAVFKEKGYDVSRDSIDKKFRNLKQTYARIKEMQNTGKTTVPTKWAYYDQMDEIIGLDMCNTQIKILETDPLQTFNSFPLPSVVLIDSALSAGDVSTTSVSAKRIKTERSNNIPRPSTSESAADEEPEAKKSRNNYLYRMEQLKLERERVKSIRELKQSLDRNNELLSESVEVQRERNILLQEYLNRH